MNRNVAFVLGMALCSLSNVASAEPMTVKDVGFAAPAAARFDPTRDRYLVSNINGAPATKDNNGFISTLSADGAISNLKWIAGGKNGVQLNAPKGFVVAGDLVYVADIDTIRVFDAASGRPKAQIRVEGAKLLQDVAVAADGTLYACDSGSNPADGALFKLVAGKATLLARGLELFRPNAIGILPDGNLIVTPGIGSTLLTVSPTGKLLDLHGFPSMLLPFQPRSPENLSGVIVIDSKSVLVATREGRTVGRVRLQHDPALSTYLQFNSNMKSSIMQGGTLAMNQRSDRERAEAAAKLSDGASPPAGDAAKQWLFRPFVRAADPDSEVIKGVSDPAKIGLDNKRRQVLIPQIESNSLVIAPLPGEEQTGAQQGDSRKAS